MTSPSRSCGQCAHSLSCYARIQLELMIQDFKLLAMDSREQDENGDCCANAEDLRAALAGACVVFVREGKG